jgi:hypothetical protein
MPTPVEVSRIKRNGDRIERLGGMWRDRPWSMSERNVIVEVERGDHWAFFVHLDGENLPLTLTSVNGRKHLAIAGKPVALLGLPEWRPDEPMPA